MEIGFKAWGKSSVEQLSTIGVLFMASGSIFITLFGENLAFKIAAIVCLIVGLVFTVLACSRYFKTNREKVIRTSKIYLMKIENKLQKYPVIEILTSVGLMLTGIGLLFLRLFAESNILQFFAGICTGLGVVLMLSVVWGKGKQVNKYKSK